jgi:multisubunit Na+/H+ antiporter MnhB subunit
MGLGVAFWYVTIGYAETKRRLPWLRPVPLIAGGLLLAMATGAVSALLTGNVAAPVDFGRLLGLPLPRGFALSSAFLFELTICLTVLGSVTFMIDTLGHPKDEP